MSFIRWYKPGAGRGRFISNQPFVTIQASKIIFSTALARATKIREFNYVKLACDSTFKLIGIMPAKDRDARTLKISKGFTCAISATSFVQHFKIQQYVGKHFKAGWDDKEGMIIVDLKEEVKKG